MRMKKLLIIAAAALLAAACAKTYEVKETTPPAIGFGSWSELFTKARTQGSSTWTNGDTFIVEGFKTVDSTPSTVFNDVTVTYDSAEDEWGYTGTRFWDSNASGYTFFAVSSPTTTLSFESDGKINATAVTFNGENNDILLANSVEVAPANFKSDVPVAFNFKHIGALVDLKVKKAATLAGATVAISSIALEGIDDEATIAVSGYSSNVPTVDWGSLANDDNSTYGRTSGVVDVTLPTDVKDDGTDYLINTLIVIPQTLTDTKTLKITYTITDAANNVNTFTDKVIKLNAFDKVENTQNVDDPDKFIVSWAASTHYIYLLTIDANTINFTGSITDWETTINGYHYLVQ